MAPGPMQRPVLGGDESHDFSKSILIQKVWILFYIFILHITDLV